MSADFKYELYQVAEKKAAESNYAFSRAAKNDLQDLIKSGIEKMPANQLNSISERNIIEKNIEKLVAGMVENSSLRNKPHLLDFISLYQTKEKLCPLFPFC